MVLLIQKKVALLAAASTPLSASHVQGDIWSVAFVMCGEPPLKIVPNYNRASGNFSEHHVLSDVGLKVTNYETK